MSKTISQQGSNRHYFREVDAQGKTYIRVEGTNKEENSAFVYLSQHFASKGLPVPRVYEVNEEGMTYTQDDLGDLLLFDAIRHGRETGEFSVEEKDLLARTLRALAHIQIKGAEGLDWSYCFPVPAMDERAIRWDLNYFKYCFLKGTKIEFSEPLLEDEFDRLTAVILAQPADSFLYRDCQSRNVMIKDGQPFFIDFQGGRRGPTQYDVASFLWQAKANIPAALREELIELYLNELQSLLPSLDKQAWKDALPHFVLFRTLQVLGAYGYRGFFERKQHFIQSIPNALRNLREVLECVGDDYPYLCTVAAQLVSTVLSDTTADEISQNLPAPNALTVTVYSFSFKKGLPVDESGNGGGYIFDCRSTHNPGKYEQYKQLTGLDQPVIDFLEQDGEITTFLQSVDKLIDHHVERFLERGFTHLQVCFGCTGGQHRSVYSAEYTAKRLHAKYGVRVHLIHRERGIDRILS
ncbi:MAG: RNase adapter RapZ [Paludibacteraceae bacterium]|nr:RNase adapter RapZ [Paludibacteraceae bacterium]